MSGMIPYFEPQDATPNPFPERPTGYPKAWTRATLRREDYLFPIPQDCLRELATALASQEARSIPTLQLTPERFELAACRAFMGKVKETLDDGVGFAVLDRLPLDVLSKDEAKAAYWLLGLMIGSPYFQASYGEKAELLSDVMDLSNYGADPDEPLPPRLENYGRLAHGARGDITNSRLVMHTDFSHAVKPPRYVGLLCLQTALQGGETRLISWHSVFNELLTNHPQLARRGFRAFLQHRQQIQARDETPFMSKPLFTYERGFRMQYSSRLVRTGYREAGVPLDEETERFLDTVDDIIANGELRTEFFMEPGQIQIVTNDECGHERTEYKDPPDPAKRRHMVRLHLQEKDRPIA